LNLTGAHTVSLVLADTVITDEDPLVTAVERMVGATRDGVAGGLLVASKEGQLVCLSATADPAGRTVTKQVGTSLARLLAAAPGLPIGAGKWKSVERTSVRPGVAVVRRGPRSSCRGGSTGLL